MITLLVSGTGTFIFVRKGQASARRWVKGGNCALCPCTCGKKKHIALTSFGIRSLQISTFISVWFARMQRPSATSERCAPWWQHLALQKGRRGVFLKGFDTMMSFIRSNALILWNLKASPLISHFKPLLPAWFQNSFTLVAELLTSAASELRSPVC